MAVLLQLTVTPATREQFDELDVRVGQSMAQAGGPPAGLMSHVAYPERDGFSSSPKCGVRRPRGNPVSTRCCYHYWRSSDSKLMRAQCGRSGLSLAREPWTRMEPASEHARRAADE
jgi:hypothetical protein